MTLSGIIISCYCSTNIQIRNSEQNYKKKLTKVVKFLFKFSLIKCLLWLLKILENILIAQTAQHESCHQQLTDATCAIKMFTHKDWSHWSVNVTLCISHIQFCLIIFYSGHLTPQEAAETLPASTENDLRNQFILSDSDTHFNFAAEHLWVPC